MDTYDTNPEDQVLSAGKSIPHWQRWIIVILVLCVLVAGGIKAFGKIVSRSSNPKSVTVEASPPPPTGTFVDSLVGTVLYMEDTTLREFSFPERRQKVVVGIKDQQAKTQLTTTPPAWSPDGRLLALPIDRQTIAITVYDSGFLKSTLTLPTDVQNEFSLSFSPYNDVISVGLLDTSTSHHDDVLFFDTSTGTQIGRYANCSHNGVWLSQEGYVTSCWLGEQESIVLIRFSPQSTTMITLARNGPSAFYKIIPISGTTSVFVQRTKKAQVELGSLTMDAVFHPLSASQKKALPDIETMSDPLEGLKKRIQTTLKLQAPVDAVSVASNNQWLAYTTSGKLFVIDIALKETPFMIGDGKNPQIRPY